MFYNSQETFLSLRNNFKIIVYTQTIKIFDKYDYKMVLYGYYFLIFIFEENLKNGFNNSLNINHNNNNNNEFIFYA